MTYYPGMYKQARQQWLDLAEYKAQKRGYEFIRDGDEQDAFQIPGNRTVKVRVSREQSPVVKLTVNEEMGAINGEFGDLGDRFLSVILLIDHPKVYDPDRDDFAIVRDTHFESGDYTREKPDGKTELAINIEEPFFRRTMSKWDWVFEK